jgi:hypothetical protein
MRICSKNILGRRFYQVLQKKAGRLNPSPWERLATQNEMAQWLLNEKFSPIDKVFFEVGTGHKPIVPVGFFLSGAKRVITVDLNERLDFNIFRKSLKMISENKQFLENIYKDSFNSNIL